MSRWTINKMSLIMGHLLNRLSIKCWCLNLKRFNWLL